MLILRSLNLEFVLVMENVGLLDVLTDRQNGPEDAAKSSMISIRAIQRAVTADTLF